MPERGTETILVVDDHTIVLTLADVMLRRSGYNVLITHSGDEALRLFEVSPDQRVDVAILDIVMPGMDGFELAERLRIIRPMLPVLYMSAYPASELQPEPMRNVPFLAKPFTSLALRAKIRETLDQPNRTQASTSRSGTSIPI
jgi:CheY-like chemotaxis protein